MRGLLGLLSAAFRVLGLVVLACLLIFPAFKGVWLGYVPVAAALFLVVALRHPRSPLRPLKDWVYFTLARGSDGRFLSLLLLLLVLLQVALVHSFRSVPTSDALYVYDQARTFAETGAMPPLTYYAPAQTWWYAVAFILLQPSYEVAQLCQVPFVIAFVCVVFLLARGLFHGASVRIVTLAAALYPTYVVYTLTTPYYFYIYTFLLTWTILEIFAASAPRSYHCSSFLAGAAGGAAALAQPVILVAPFLAGLIWISWGGPKPIRNTLKRLGIFVVGMGIVLTPWTVRNYFVFKQPILVCTAGGLVFYSANNPSSNGIYSRIPDDVKPRSPEEMLEHSRYCWTQGWRFISDQPLAFLRLVLLKTLHTWGNEATYADSINIDGVESENLNRFLSFASQLAWACVVLLWARRAFRSLVTFAAPTRVELLVSVVVTWTWLTFAVFEAGSRHHLPVVAFLLLYVLEPVFSTDGSNRSSRDGGDSGHASEQPSTGERFGSA